MTPRRTGPARSPKNARRHPGRVVRNARAPSDRTVVHRRSRLPGADLIFQMDADLSHNPEYLPRIAEGRLKHDVVIGSST